MSTSSCFRQPRILLPRPGVDLAKWAVVACDQYTSEPEYWDRVARLVDDAPSTLNLVFPEVYLSAPDAQARIRRIQEAMQRYLAEGLLRQHEGVVLVERRIGDHTRRGLMFELDLEHYDFSRESTSMIRPTEGTMVERLAPRIAVRRDAELELPHIMVLIDDPECTVIEPLAAQRDELSRLYETDLMLGGGHVAGYAVGNAQVERALAALTALAAPEAFAKRYGVPVGTPPMQFAVGDGNHSLATAKAIWEDIKGRVGMDHPSRYALVEVENIHDPALRFEPIHRLLFGVTDDVQQALAAFFGDRFSCLDVASAADMREQVNAVPASVHAAGLIGPGSRNRVVQISRPEAMLAVATFQSFIDQWIAGGGAREVDYVHGDEVLESQTANDDVLGFYLPTVSKSDLLRRVVSDGPLPRKTFSMGEANEKRFYVEARALK